MAHEVKVRRGRKPGLKSGAATDANDSARNIQNEKPRGYKPLAWITGAVAFLIYLRTMTPAMQMGDGTELATAAYVLGVPHPTGYPFYMLLSKAWLIITMAGDPIMRTTVLNAILMAASVGVTALILADILRGFWKTGHDKALLIWAGSGALTAAFLRFHWANAVVTEVYALQFLLMVLFTRAAQKMDAGSNGDESNDGENGRTIRRGLLWATAMLALGFAHHRLSVCLIIPWLGLWFWSRRLMRSNSHSAIDATPPSRPRLPFISAAIILLAGLSLYAYLPIRASVDPPVNWGNPDSWSRFYNHARGTEYLDRALLKPALGRTFSVETLALFTRLQTTHLLSDLAGQFAPFPEQYAALPGTQKVFVKSPGLVIILGFLIAGFALWGLARLWINGRRVTAAVLATVAAQNIVILFIYNIADIRDYFLYPFWAAWIGVFCVISWFTARLIPSRRLVAAYASLLIPLCVLTGNWNWNDRSDDITAERLSAMILPDKKDVVPDGSILITDDDTETFTTWYRQIVRGERPDVLNFAGNFVYMPWYKTFFSDAQIEKYKITLADGVARSAAEYATQLRDGIIDANVAAHPVFTSINDRAVLSELAKTYAVEPVDAVEIVNRSLFDEATTTVLYRIKLKGEAQ